MLSRSLTGFTAAAAIVMMAGCESKLTQDNFAKIKPGMTLAEVNAILGPGEKQTEGQASSVAAGLAMGLPGAGGGKRAPSVRDVYIWKEGRAEISVTFDSEKVVDKGQRGL